MVPSAVKKFLTLPSNSVSREVIFAHRLTYELKVASAHWGWDLRVYHPDVDRDGFDLLVTQASIARVLQLKTVHAEARTSEWRVRTHLLHPSRSRARRLDFFSPAIGLGDGLDGAIVLLDFAVSGDDIRLSYRFFDLAVAAAHACRLTGASQKTGQKAEELLHRVRQAEGKGHVTVPASLFLKVLTAEGLLSLLGMRSRHQGSWDYNVLHAYATEFGGDVCKRKATIEQVRDLAVLALEEIRSP